MLRFEEEGHRYFWKDEEIPSVTKVLQTVGMAKSYAGIDEFYSQRGTACHRAIELFLKGQLDEESIDPCYKGHFEAFRKWWAGKSPEEVYAIELPLYSKEFGFAGTVDLVYGDTIFDFKTSKNPDPVSEVQGSAYSILWGEYRGVEAPFRVLQLLETGEYKEISYGITSPTLWSSVLEVYGWYKKAYPRRCR